MFYRIDTFNNVNLGGHRTLEAAVKADRAYQRAVKAANGAGSYIPTIIVEAEERPGKYLSAEEVARLERVALEDLVF